MISCCLYIQENKLYVQCTMKGCSVFTKEIILRGDKICDYSGELCNYATYKQRHIKYNASGSGSFILEFKFKDKWWAIDATNEDSSFGHLINHSRKLQNCRPVVGVEKGEPYVYFIATCDILPNTEILYDYGDNSKLSMKHFPWLKE